MLKSFNSNVLQKMNIHTDIAYVSYLSATLDQSASGFNVYNHRDNSYELSLKNTREHPNPRLIL